VISALVAILVVAVLFALGFVFGGPVVALILAVVGLVGAGIYVFALGGSRTTPGDVAREADEQPELLGPGGPDDPNR
jgi:nucleoside recognition membrane protein YjiH